MGHDQVFKGVLRRFFQDFLELFFPKFAARLDFESLEFQDKELFKGFPDGQRREPDVVARVRTWEGSPELVVVHIEAQATTKPDFGRRMFEYYALLWLQFDAPVFPVVLYVKVRWTDGDRNRNLPSRALRARGDEVSIRQRGAGTHLRPGVC